MVGAGNSAGQAIVYLARYARRVHVVLRGTDLGASMSRYLVDRVQGIENVTIHCGAVVTGLEGNGHLGAVHVDAGGTSSGNIRHHSLFLFIGADANTDWLRGCVELDRKGFVLTGQRAAARHRGRRSLARGRPRAVPARDEPARRLRRRRRPERLGQAVASAVGEGSMAVSFVHAHIARPA